jgi:thioredoxin 1
MATIKLTKDNFDATLENGGILIIDFWATWCGPCRAFGPVFEKASEAHTDIVFAKVNTDEERELAGSFQIMAIPTLAAFRDKVMVYKQSGTLPEAAMEELITKIQGLDMAEVCKQVEKENAD